MYDLQLTPEQLEMRDTVRDFVNQELKPAALKPARLEPFEKPLLTEVLAQASQMGLRALALPEDAGGAGADELTTCIVMEELGAGDIDVAAALAHTCNVARLVLGELATPAQRQRLLAAFTGDDAFHLALAGRDPAAPTGWCYHRPLVDDGEPLPTATRQPSGEWVIDGSVPVVPNAPIAKLYAVLARTDAKSSGADGLTLLLVPAGARGLTVRKPFTVVGGTRSDGEAVTRWHHGSAAAVVFEGVRVHEDSLLGTEGHGAAAVRAAAQRAQIELAAVNLGLGRVAYEAAVDYAKIRRQGGRNIVEHHAIGLKLAECAVKLELARSLVWKAAWAADHPDAALATSGNELPLAVMARSYTAEAMNHVALLAAECFGGMGVMRDMPLQKYVHDAMICLHNEDADDAAKLVIAEAIAGYERPLAKRA